MEIINKSPKLLSNYEVWLILKKMKEGNFLKDQKNLATITYEAIKYLEELKCVNQKSDHIHHFLNTVKEKGLRLTKAEKLQIINTRPNNLIELQLLIEENEERFSEDALNLILNIVKLTLPDSSQRHHNLRHDNNGYEDDENEEDDEDDEDDDDDDDENEEEDEDEN